MKLILKSVGLISSILWLASCQHPDEGLNSADATARRASPPVEITSDPSVKSDYEVRDGILYFKDINSFTLLDRKLRDVSQKERIEFTNQIGFKSLLQYQSETYEKLGGIDNKDQYEKIVLENKDIFTIENNELTPTFDQVSATLLNREGMVSIGGTIHCFAKDRTIVGQTLDKVRQAYSTGKKPDETVSILQVIQPETGSKPGAKMSASCAYFDQTATSNGNREARIRVSNNYRDLVASYTYGIYYYNREYYTYVLGVPRKKNFFGTWVNYSTGNTLYSRFIANVFVNYDPYSLPWLQGQYGAHTINDTRSNDGESIDFSPVMLTLGPVTEFYLVSGGALTPAFSLSEGSPLGLYTSGGVPGGVQMKCL